MKMERNLLGPFWKGVVFLTYGMTFISCAGLVVMMLVTGADVLLRQIGYPLKGAYDVVRICGALTIACALPLTTAVKGHIAIEYFFQKLSTFWRIVVDSVMRLVMIASFALAAWGCVVYGQQLLRNGEVTATIGLPLFWVPWLMAVSFAVTAVIVVFHLLYPGRRMVQI
jgi:TRAP-type C4-dicarboxylate transport system permease small subunit